MKRTTIILFFALLLSISVGICFASVPLRWTVETSLLQPVAFDALHGETLELSASFQSYGKPFAVTGPAALYYQTNGMGSAWWSVPATVSSNRIEAVFPPSADPGAPRLTCFLGGTASTYRAAFSLRFAPSPGATPNALPPPVTKLDPAPVTSVNGMTGAVVLAAADVGARPNDWTPSAADVGALPTTGGNILGDIKFMNDSRLFLYGPTFACLFMNATKSMVDIDGDNLAYLKVGHEEFGEDGNHLRYLGETKLHGTLTINNTNVMEAISSNNSKMSNLSKTVNQWTTYWDGDDVRDTVTNYYGSTGIPARYLEQKMPADDTHNAPWFKMVWSELTRWNRFLGSGWDWMDPNWMGFAAWKADLSAQLAQKADRAWGFYDSGTGEYSPDGFLQISTPNIIIAKDLAYQKTVTTGGCSMWVLTATQPVALTGETEQGYFRITDGDGNALFEIVKGDKRIAGATATALTMDGGSIVIPYSVTGDNPQPTLSVCTDLAAEDWQTGDAITVAAVSWAVSDGHWVATVTPMGPRPSLFFKASYEAGGNTYIKNNVATSIDKVVVGGHEYTVTVETVNGKKLLVLQ